MDAKTLHFVPMEQMDIKWLRGVGEIAAVKSDWHDLERRQPDHYLTQKFDWIWSAIELGGRKVQKNLHCLTAWNGNVLVAVWPFTIRRRLGFRVATRLGCGSGEDYGPPLFDKSVDAGRLSGEFLRELLRMADAVKLPAIRSDDPVFGVIEFLPTDMVHKWETGIQTIRFSNYKDWTAFEETLSKKLRTSIRYEKERIRKSHGEFRVGEAAGQDEMDCLLAFFLEMKAKKLVEMNPYHWLRTPEAETFLRHTLKLSNDERPRMMGAWAGDKPMAAAICFVDRVRSVFFATTYDEAFSCHSPGRLLLQGCIKWAYDNGKEFDFGTTIRDYKERWGGDKIDCRSYTLVSNVRGRMFVALYDLARLVRRKAGIEATKLRKLAARFGLAASTETG